MITSQPTHYADIASCSTHYVYASPHVQILALTSDVYNELIIELTNAKVPQRIGIYKPTTKTPERLFDWRHLRGENCPVVPDAQNICAFDFVIDNKIGIGRALE
jgi:hypothetical protein